MSDTINYQTPKPQFDIGRVINRTFAAIKNKPVIFVVTSLIVIGIPMFLIGLLPMFMGLNSGIENNPDAIENMVTGTIIASVVTGIFLLVASVILQGALIFAAVRDFNGEDATLGEAFRIGLRYFFPLLGMGILIGLGVMAGFLLLIVPGVLIALGWSIAAPIMIVEEKSITDAIGRSWELTKGYKRWILLLWIILMIISLVIGGVLGAFTLIAGDPTTVLLEGASNSYYITSSIFSALSQAITTMISTAGVAAVYYDIRQIKEGIGAENLAAVFD